MIDLRIIALLLLPRVCPVCGESKYLFEFHANWRCAMCESKRHKTHYRLKQWAKGRMVRSRREPENLKESQWVNPDSQTRSGLFNSLQP